MKMTDDAATALPWIGEDRRAVVWDFAVRVCERRGGTIVEKRDVDEAVRRVRELGGFAWTE
jgi:hypothetical protein